ncbi:MAG: hypothetical protein KKF12_21285 [Proteobacteria bacterium]|nr:hypothetical protein [Desulfobacula sp.]MBU3952549.1 hypothetical protein [Pseudomonadota bacterium]MBU4133363.1 hypothetical protein [Pseudomonadota bacterium]
MYILKMNGEKIGEAAERFEPVQHGWKSGVYMVQSVDCIQEYVPQEGEDETGLPFESIHPDKEEPTGPGMVTVIEFKMCFTSPERIAIYALRDAGDPVMTDWLSILDDPRCTGVDLGLESTRSGVEYLVDKVAGFTESRANSVLKGEMI